VFDNVLVQPRDAREASDVFYRQRLGDVLLTYENEVVLTNQVRLGLSIILDAF
jgi:ABC-type sulfate transport system substrate-binding protein